jgi:hypothetical protein
VENRHEKEDQDQGGRRRLPLQSLHLQELQLLIP